MSIPKLCPHNILGIGKCKQCHRDSAKKSKIKSGIFKGVGKGNPIICSHGIKPKRNCELCHKERSNKQYKENHKNNPNFGIGRGYNSLKPILCIHGILGKTKCKLCFREWQNKAHAKRKRNLGYIPINESFEGSVGHHIDTEFVVYIPEKLHLSLYPHSAISGLNMEIVNAKVFDWLLTQKHP